MRARDRFARFFSLAGLLLGAWQLIAEAGIHVRVAGEGWPTYGGDPGGQRYTDAVQINKSNLQQLRVAWTFHTGGYKGEIESSVREGSFEATPILFKGSLYVSSAFDQVFALDPATGAKRWTFDLPIDWKRFPDTWVSRGVAAWSETRAGGKETSCRDRIFIGTVDARLISLDAASGQPCTDFGHAGTVDLALGVEYLGRNYRITSPPTVVGDVVVVGSAIGDDQRVDVELGIVRGYDARTGALLWTWDPLPWARTQKPRTGAGNTWSVIAADLKRGLVYLPTSSPSPDSYGGLRPGDNRDADSIVCLDAKTGKKVWSFQIVHHNLWDYDLAAEPLLFEFRGETPAVAVATKMGTVFVFNRLTGEPLYKITERRVPQSDVPGEVSSPTQPFSELPPLNPLTIDTTKPLGADAGGDAQCRRLMRGLRYEGVFTPPSLRGTIVFPGPVGGVNWGSTALDPATGILYANTNRAPYWMRLIDPQVNFRHRKEMIVIPAGFVILALITICWKIGQARGLGAASVLILIMAGVAAYKHPAISEWIHRTPWVVTSPTHFGGEIGPNVGAPYMLLRQPLSAAKDRPCSPLPWGTVSALNLTTGKIAWQATLGTEVPDQHTGTWNVGGPIVTASGLIFTAASTEPYLRAFDAATGQELWRGMLPVPAQATPMSYTVHGKQYIVIAAGGHPEFGTKTDDELVAFALP